MTFPPSDELRFKEIEHKFVVDDRFDLDRFRSTLEALHPTRVSSVDVLDTYYLLGGNRRGRFVIRHRYDPELHHLTLKTVETDPEVREEINLDLGHQHGDQSAAVNAFLEQLDVEWSGSLKKELNVWYFPDIEVVHYTASTDTAVVRCVEFEARRKDSLTAALDVLHRYERTTGFDAADRSHQSLVALLFPEVTRYLV